MHERPPVRDALATRPAELLEHVRDGAGRGRVPRRQATVSRARSAGTERAAGPVASTAAPARRGRVRVGHGPRSPLTRPSECVVALFLIGILSQKKILPMLTVLDKIVALSNARFPRAVAHFGALHLLPQFVRRPCAVLHAMGRMFWVYFVGCGNQRAANEIDPKHASWHVARHKVFEQTAGQKDAMRQRPPAELHNINSPRPRSCPGRGPGRYRFWRPVFRLPKA